MIAPSSPFKIPGGWRLPQLCVVGKVLGRWRLTQLCVAGSCSEGSEGDLSWLEERGVLCKLVMVCAAVMFLGCLLERWRMPVTVMQVPVMPVRRVLSDVGAPGGGDVADLGPELGRIACCRE
ncbi:hypothetical protein IGI04_024078 [Brassica rapa subsp. trilocularis]|uniref:Uncharacterized protein n=1 Tax=Brassica rapa subsp. trilocularis TaxID=1813537 RepID=A0ABQ7M718_BRACM|nr:hypothetical protein IGI04_024078 [Brassica rapa subsp. trilocularis]